LLSCPPWQLVEQLDFEKEVTGMYMSGHPLDNFKFELKHYNIVPLADFNEVKNAMNSTPPPSKQFRLAGLVIDAQHRLTKTGKNFGVLHIEDFSGKSEFMLWSEDYAKYTHYIEKGMIVMVEGSFRSRYNTDQYEFKLAKLHLLETVKSALTRQVIIDVLPQHIDEEFVSFIDQNVKTHPGKTTLKFHIADNTKNIKLSMYTLEKGFTMNDEMAVFLNSHKHLEVSVLTN
jgi:DNA polymerase-3 subunit alpha